MYIENAILAALPQRKYARLFAKLQSVTLNMRHVIVEQGRPIRHIYFPTTAMISLLSIGLDRKKGVGVATVGSEGLLGVSVFLGDAIAPGCAIVQLAGHALRVEAQIFRELLERDGLLPTTLRCYAQVQLTAITSAAYCNCFHKVDERLARWLLLTHDRARSDTFPLTQEFAAYLLGLHRPVVTVAAHTFQDSGLIRYSHGQMTILNRQALEAAACECYSVVKNEYARLLGNLLSPNNAR
jgi:CRP-like cAMP-binding protein